MRAVYGWWRRLDLDTRRGISDLILREFGEASSKDMRDNTIVIRFQENCCVGGQCIIAVACLLLMTERDCPTNPIYPINPINNSEESPFRPGDYYLYNVVVDPKYRGMGYGSILMDRVIQYVEKNSIQAKIWLYVKPMNETARRLYLNKGWNDDGKLHLGEKRMVRIIKMIILPSLNEISSSRTD